MKPTVYVAFLRGVNVGGNALIGMEALKAAFTRLGFTNVRTVLASGNVVFEAPHATENSLSARITEGLRTSFGLEVEVQVRTGQAIQALLAAEPFGHGKVDAHTRWHVTFLPPNSAPALKIGDRLQGTELNVRRVSPGELCSLVELKLNQGTPELMKVLEKRFGRKITTRTWNTVERIGKLLENS